MSPSESSQPAGEGGTPRPARSIATALVLFFLGAALAVHDLANSNRPHELRMAPLVALLFAASTALAGRGMLLLERSRRESQTNRVTTHLRLVALGAFTTLNLLLLASAIKTALVVLRD